VQKKNSRPQQVHMDDALDRQIEAALAWHDDDPRATIATLLEDILYLRRQLVLTEGVMSRGMTRGWVPGFREKSPSGHLPPESSSA
jgi:hypothetical protein